jgi:hypothetical protein
MVEAARTEAALILESDPELTKNPLLKKYSQPHQEIHFE